MKTSAGLFTLFVLLLSASLVCCKKNNDPVIISTDFTYRGIFLTDSPITFHNVSTNATLSWDFGDGGHSNEKSPVHTYTAPGTYTVMLIVNNNAANAVRRIITIAKNPKVTQQMGGLRLWHHRSNAVTPSGGGVTNYPDTSFAVEYVDPLTVTIGGSVFQYAGSANGDTTLTFEMREYTNDNTIVTRTDYLLYTPAKDSLHWIADSISTLGYRGAHHYITP